MAIVTTTEQIEQRKLKDETTSVIQKAQMLQVGNPAEHGAAIDFLKTIKASQERVTGFFGPMKKKAHEAWRLICDGENEFITPLKESERIAKDKVLRFQFKAEQERVQAEREAQARADEAARKERERLEKEAEKLKTPEKKAERLEQAAAVVAPVIEVASEVPKVGGVSTTKRWKHRVVDVAKLPREYMLPNEKMLAGIATSTKGQIKIEGVEFYSEASLSVGK